MKITDINIQTLKDEKLLKLLGILERVMKFEKFTTPQTNKVLFYYELDESDGSSIVLKPEEYKPYVKAYKEAKAEIKKRGLTV